MMGPVNYQEACAQHRWQVPEHYNIAQDVCDRHPRERLAMVHEDFKGNARRASWGELQDNSKRFANVLQAHGITKGDRVAMLLPPTPETAAAFFGTWRTGAILLSMSTLYGDEGIRHRLSDSQPKVVLTNRDNADRIDRSLTEHVLILDEQLLGTGEPTFENVQTSADDPAQLYYSSGTTGLAKGILHAHRYILAHEEFIYCHDVKTKRSFTAWASGPGRPASARCWVPGVWERCRPSTSARAALTPTSNLTSSRATGSPTCSRRPPRSAR